MKKFTRIIAAGALSACLIGCGKQENPPPPTQQVIPPKPKVEAPPEPVAPVAPAAAATPLAPTAATDQAQGLIDKVKDLIAKKDYTGALNTLKELSSIQLTPDQQQMVDSLKAQVQKAMASGAASDLGNSATGLMGK